VETLLAAIEGRHLSLSCSIRQIPFLTFPNKTH
jgi:hypothetical protein